ncbi:MAG: elongator complex protein 3 [Oscillospiraceae bacterium]
MSHSNISVFVPHAGCKHRCSFCDQRTITGVINVPHADDVKRICEKAMGEVSDISDTEIAFFGGSFTAIPREYMIELLSAAKGFVGENGFKGIRISTRPDCISEEILDILSAYGVTAIELGAQSLDDNVLLANERGHNAETAANASRMIKSYSFELGLQIMTGLYKSDEAAERLTLKRALEIHPDTVRIYPVCVLKGTRLAALYESGEYKLMPFDKMIGLCAEMAAAFSEAGISLLKIGLHASENVESELLAGYYHPALGELVRSRAIRDIIEKHIGSGRNSVTVYVPKNLVSAAAGHKKSNKLYFYEKGVTLEIKRDDSLLKNEIRIDKDVYKCI